MKKFVILFLLIFPTAAFSQNATDSLETLLVKSEGKEKLSILYDLSSLYWRTDSQKSINYALQALEMARESNYSDLNKALAFKNLGISYYYSGDYAKSIENSLEAINIYEELVDKGGKAKSLNTIGLVYRKIGEYEKALDYSYESLKLREELDNKVGISIMQSNIGLVYLDLKNFDKAAEYFTNSSILCNEIGLNKGIAEANMNLAAVYEKKGNQDSSLFYIESALNFWRENNIKPGWSNALIAKGEIFRKQNETNKALVYFTEALEIKREYNDTEGIVKTLSALGDIQTVNGSYKKGERLLIEALTLAKKEKINPLIYEIYNNLSSLYLKRENYRKAHRYLSDAVKVKDTLFDEGITQKSIEIQTKYESEAKIKENVLLQKNNELQRHEINSQKNMRNLAAVILILVTGFTLLLYRRYRINKELNALLQENNTKISRQKEQLDLAVHDLEKALGEIKTLSGLLPICSHCQKIRDDKGFWHRVEKYISQHTEAQFTHGLCDDCVKELYPEFYDKSKDMTD